MLVKLRYISLTENNFFISFNLLFCNQSKTKPQSCFPDGLGKTNLITKESIDLLHELVFAHFHKAFWEMGSEKLLQTQERPEFVAVEI